MTKPLEFVLIHGSWHDGGMLQPVVDGLAALGHRAHAPTLAGHGKDADKSADHARIVEEAVADIRDRGLTDIVLFGHSFGGTVVQRIAEELPDRIRRLVFHNAFIALDGESLVDMIPPHLQAIWPSLVADDGGLSLPYPVWRDGFIGDADAETAQAVFDRLSPTPARSHFDKITLTRFPTLEIPRSYLWASDDAVLPPGEQWGWHPRLSARLGAYRLVSLPGSHEVLLTNTPLFVERLVAAGRD